MKVAGIIAEYNPFHKGHAYHIRKTRQIYGATHIVAVMSGHTVQRGDLAIFSKWTRAKAAVECGADLVLELPIPFSCASAPRFAKGALETLTLLGNVSLLSFGSECGNIEALMELVELEEQLPKAVAEDFIREGKSYPRVYQETVREKIGCGAAALLESPNNTLALEYIRALRRMKSDIVPVTVLRKGPAHDSSEADQQMAGASYIRSLLQKGQTAQALAFVPTEVAALYQEELLSGFAPCRIESVEPAFLYRLRQLTREDLAQVPDVSEGLENRIADCVLRSANLSELLELLKTKRYTMARLRRVLLAAVLGIRREDYEKPPSSLRVLAFNQRGAELLRNVKENTDIVFAPKPRREGQSSRQSQLESNAASLFFLSSPRKRPLSDEYTQKIEMTQKGEILR